MALDTVCVWCYTGGVIDGLRAEREGLLASLADVEERLRGAVVEAVRSGRPVAVVAREAGVTRPTVYAWVRAAPPAVDLEARLSELDARWDALVDALVQRDMPAGEISQHGNKQSGLQVEARGRKVSKGVESATALYRRGAETKLLSLVADKADEDPTFAAIRDELAEAWDIRQSLAARNDSELGI